MQKIPEQGPGMAVEEYFELSDAAGPNLLHHLFVFHIPPFVIVEYCHRTKRLRAFKYRPAPPHL
jgi:hypothetical protein